MSSQRHKTDIPWGPALLSGVGFVCKVQQPKVPDLPDDVKKEINYELFMDNYAFEVEKAFLNKLTKQEEEKTKRLNAEKAALESTKCETKIPQTKTSTTPAVSQAGLLYTPKFERDSSNQIKTLTPLRDKEFDFKIKDTTTKKSEHDSLLRDFDQADNPFDAAELNTLDDIKELRELLSRTVAPIVSNSTQEKDLSTDDSVTMSVQESCSQFDSVRTFENGDSNRKSPHKHEASASNSLKSIQFPQLNVSHSSQSHSGHEKIIMDSIIPSPPSISPQPSHRVNANNTSTSNCNADNSVSSQRVTYSSLYNSCVLPNYPRHLDNHQVPLSKSQSNFKSDWRPAETPACRNSSSLLKETNCYSDHVAKVRLFEMQGIPTEDAEQAMIFFPSDLQKALQFAKMKHELQEFGFSAAKVQEILISCDLDREKAINILQTLPLTPT